MATAYFNSYVPSPTQKPSSTAPSVEDQQPPPGAMPPFSIGGAPSPAQQTYANTLNKPLATTATPIDKATSAVEPTPTGGKPGVPGPVPGTPGTTTANGTTTQNASNGATGSNLPAYGANFSFWQNNSGPGQPGANTVYNAPGSLGAMGVNSNTAQYDPSGNNAPTWNQPGGSSQAAYQALQQILGGDASGMDTSAIKNRLKEQRLAMEKDQLGASRQSAAGRGMLDSGFQGGQERRLQSESRKDILGGFRDVDIAAADASVKNRLAGSEALNQLLSGDTARASTGFTHQLQGAQHEDQQNQFAFNAGQEQFNNQLNAGKTLEELRQGGAQSALQSYQSGADTSFKTREQDMQVAQHKTNELLGRLGIAVNLEEIAKGSSRDKMQFLTDIFQTLVQNEQHNAQMGLSYSQLGLDMKTMLANVVKGIGM